MNATLTHTVITVGLIFGTLVAASAQSPGRLNVNVTGLRNDNGVVRCGLYASADGFRQPGREFRGAIARIRGNQATCSFGSIPAGNYAVAVFHAEQNETQMDVGMFGKPKQGFGFSRNPSAAFGPPSFSAAAFDYKGDNQALQVRLQY
jgi:uncharacterized protein (DUF2141 family)